RRPWESYSEGRLVADATRVAAPVALLRGVGDEFECVPRCRFEVAGHDRVDVIGWVLPGIEHRLERLLEEPLDAGRGEGEDHPHHFRAGVVEGVHGSPWHVDEVAGAGQDRFVAE